MKQLILDLKTGKPALMEVPAPIVQDGHLLVQTSCSLVSPGTERMLVAFGKAGWLNRARQQPEKVQQVFSKIKTDGLKATLHAVKGKLGQPMPLGYSQCGRILAVGKGVTGFAIGDRVISNGPHAEVVLIPQNLAAKIPASVPDTDAVFTVIAAIALQSIRLAAPTFGETVAVIGLGLLGQLTAQLLQAAGCKVIGFDINDSKVALATESGILAANSNTIDPVSFATSRSPFIGVDAVIITASSTTSDIVSTAAQMSRKRGRIVLSGVTGLHLHRADFYEKELTFQVSCSYGPGRHDAQYEQGGMDYPVGFVRWTEQRNFEAVLEALASGKLNVQHLISQNVSLEEFGRIYDQLDGKVVAGILAYNMHQSHSSSVTTNAAIIQKHGIGIIGSGSFTTSILLPALKSEHASLIIIAGKSGLTAATLAKKYELSASTTDYLSVLKDERIGSVFITTRHKDHAAMTSKSLEAGKHVFVEKPLAIDHNGLEEIAAAYKKSGKQLYVGYNRRFAPFTNTIKELLKNAHSIHIIITVNAGKISEKHWLNDPSEGGRIIGEVCHFIDLASYVCGASVTAVTALANQQDEANILLQFENGNTASINYLTNGSVAYDKERIEVFSDGRTLVLENWRKLTGYGFKEFSSKKSAQNKGHEAQFKMVLKAMKTGTSLIPFHSLINTTKATLAVLDSIHNQCWITIS